MAYFGEQKNGYAYGHVNIDKDFLIVCGESIRGSQIDPWAVSDTIDDMVKYFANANNASDLGIYEMLLYKLLPYKLSIENCKSLDYLIHIDNVSITFNYPGIILLWTLFVPSSMPVSNSTEAMIHMLGAIVGAYLHKDTDLRKYSYLPSRMVASLMERYESCAGSFASSYCKHAYARHRQETINV